MSIFSTFFKSRDKPTNSTPGSAYSFFLGSSSSGKRVTEQTAMQMTAVYCCVRILSEAIAGLPLHLYRRTESDGKEKAVDHPLYFLLHDEPNPEMTSFIFRETLMTHLLLWGNAYAQIIRNGRGEVLALYPLMPNHMSVDRDEHGKLYYTYQRSDDEAPAMKGSMVRLDPRDVLHIPGLGFDGLVGYSPIAMAKNAIGILPDPTEPVCSILRNEGFDLCCMSVMGFGRECLPDVCEGICLCRRLLCRSFCFRSPGRGFRSSGRLQMGLSKEVLDSVRRLDHPLSAGDHFIKDLGEIVHITHKFLPPLITKTVVL